MGWKLSGVFLDQKTNRWMVVLRRPSMVKHAILRDATSQNAMAWTHNRDAAWALAQSIHKEEDDPTA